MDRCQRLSGEMACIKNDEASARLALLMHETEDESVFLRFAMRVCNKKWLTYRGARRKLMDDLFAGDQIVAGHGFKRADLRFLTRARIAQSHITVARFAADIKRH